MEKFPDGALIRLRSRVRRKYLNADEDGIGVFLSPKGASFNAAWRVHRVVRNGVSFVLLHGAAYGRYLAASDDPAPPDHRGKRVVQGVYDDLEADDVMWTAVEARDGDHVLLRHVSGRFLRARRKIWKNGVSVVHHPDNPSTMMHWVVERLRRNNQPPPIQPLFPRVRCSLGYFHRRMAPFPERTIRCVRADNSGNFNNDDGWATFQFEGRSVYFLKWEVVTCLGLPFITMCTRAGRYGRLTPAVIDLPRILLPMDIIALPGDSPASLELQYPRVYDLNPIDPRF